MRIAVKCQSMNNKEFITELAARTGYSIKETTELVKDVFDGMMSEWQSGNLVTIQGFGTFEVKKKLERISVNPTTQQRMLVPPKLVLTYKPSTVLKEKFK